MSKACVALLWAGLLAAPVPAQTPVQAFLKDVGAYPREDHHLRRTLALVVASAHRLAELEAASSGDAARFRAAFEKQVRRARAVLSLLGTNSLDAIRQELADNLGKSFGSQSRSFDRFMGAIAGREGRGIESGKELKDTVSAAIRVLSSADEPRQQAVAHLLIEATAVVRFLDADRLALQGISLDLSRL